MMSDQDASTSSRNDVITSYAEILAAFRIIRTLKIENLKLNPIVFSEPLYRDTILHRAPEDHEFPGANEVLMKNVYYMATLTESVSDAVVDQLLASAILTEEECNEIRNLPTNKLRCVKMFTYLVEKEDPDNRIIAGVIAALKQGNNECVVALLESFLDDEIPDNVDNTNAYEPSIDNEHPDGAHAVMMANDETEEGCKNEVKTTSSAVTQNFIPNQKEGWTCRFCTFLNNSEINICEICAKTDNSDPKDNICEMFCPRCTFVNQAGVTECIVCWYKFNEFLGDGSDDDNPPIDYGVL